jgi:hypothetical protein
MSNFQLPRIDQRVTIMGRTGSGKTQFGAWLLSVAPFTEQPYVMIDYKYDALLNSITRVREIGFNEVPKEPGLYVLHPLPEADDDNVDNFLRRVWSRENIGLFFDETTLVPDRSAFRSILTQGRSKHIPAIMLTQRPAWVSKHCFTDAEYYALFHMQHQDDHKRIRGFIPDIDLASRLPDWHSRWYDVSQDKLFTLGPAPSADEIVETIDRRLEPKRKWF